MVADHGQRRARAADRLQRRKDSIALLGVRRRQWLSVAPTAAALHECMHGHAAASVTGLQLMSAAVHLDAAWSDGLGEKLGVKRTPRAAVIKENTVTAPAACTAAVAAGRSAAWKH